MLKPKQVDLSILFPKSSLAEGQLTTLTPMFLFGEKRQAVLTSTLIPPVKRVEKINRECNRINFQNYLYVSCYLCFLLSV